jgi:hypothetical protein
MEKELIIMSHYVCVRNKATIESYVNVVTDQTKDDPKYRFKHFVLAVKESHEQRVECIYPNAK